MSAEKKLAPVFRVYSPSDLSKAWFIYFNQNGKRIKVKGGINRYRTFHERMTAAKALMAELSQSASIRFPVVCQMKNWIENRKNVMRLKGYRTYRSKVDVFLRWLGKRDVSNKVLREFFTELLQTRHPTTYMAFRQTFRQLFKELGKPEMMNGIDTLKTVKTPAKYFQAHQVQRLKKALLERYPDLWLFSQFIYFCFLRPGKECRLLKVGDIQFDDWKICVPADRSKNKKQQFVTIPHAFRPHLEFLKEKRPADFVFPSPLDPDKPIGENTILKRYRKIFNELGFGLEYSVYSWKHTGAVAAVRAGISLNELQIQLRHYSLNEVQLYIRQLGVHDLQDLENKFPAI